MKRPNTTMYDTVVGGLFFIKGMDYWLFVALILPIVILTIAIFVPIRYSESLTKICLVCGTVDSETSVQWSKMWKRDSQDRRHWTYIRSLYDNFIGDAHDHEWCGAYRTVRVGNMFSWKVTDREMWRQNTDESYYQPRLTHMALVTALRLRYASPELRKSVYYKMVNSRVYNDYVRVCKIYDRFEARDSLTAEATWTRWLEEDAVPVDAADSGDLPAWVFDAHAHIPSSQEINPEKLNQSSDYSRNWFCRNLTE